MASFLDSGLDMVLNYPTGSYAPWPNRAERILHLVKQTMFASAAGFADDPDLELVTAQQIVNRAAAACNEMRIHSSGLTPLMLSYGRQEPELGNVEVARPPNLDHSALPRNIRDHQTLVNKAQLAYVQAKQAERFKMDLAT